jgi:DNA repair protein RecO (recombination protein O)
MGKTYKTEAVVLKRINYSEADKIMTLFSKHYGKISCLAKGVRKLKSRKGGNLELFNQVTIFLAKGKNLDIVTEVQAINTFSNFKKDLYKLALAFQASELVDRITREEQENYQVYNLLIDFLSELDQQNKTAKDMLLDFKIRLLENTGFGLPVKISPESVDYHIESIIEKKVKFFYDE